MNLIIDVGNTLTKLAVFDAKGLVHKWAIEKHEFEEALHSVRTAYPDVTKCIISSVGKVPPQGLNQLEDLSVLNLTYKTKVPFTNLYTTPQTLGVDRIALVSAAAKRYSNRNVLIIDFGSCVTYDVLTSKNEYLGGVISPGLKMRYKAMNHFTAGLPLLDVVVPSDDIGNSTANAMHAGAFVGLINEVEGFIDSYSEKYEDLTVILTGGDAEILRDRLKNDIFANSNFLLEGLQCILEYNKD